MTNPNNAVGTNAAYDGRTSVNAFNDDLAAYTSGILSGWACTPNSGLTVSLGGDGSTRDVAVAEDNAGNKTSINNISGSPIDVTMSAAPGSNSRIDLVVAYVDNPPQGVNTTADNPSACGIIKVTGTASSSPVAPNDSTIRTAITGDGASGATAYYAILAYITISSGTTDITTSNIQAGPTAQLSPTNVSLASLIPQTNNVEINTGLKFGGKTIYAQKFSGSVALTANTRVEVTLATITSTPYVISTIGWAVPGSTSSTANSPITTAVYGNNGSMTGYFAALGSPVNNTIRVRWMYSTTTTGYYDIVVFYTKN